MRKSMLAMELTPMTLDWLFLGRTASAKRYCRRPEPRDVRKQTLAQSRTHGAESLHIHHDAVSVPRKQHGILVPSKERDVPHEQNRVIRTLPVGHSRSLRVSGR